MEDRPSKACTQNRADLAWRPLAPPPAAGTMAVIQGFDRPCCTHTHLTMACTAASASPACCAAARPAAAPCRLLPAGRPQPAVRRSATRSSTARRTVPRAGERRKNPPRAWCCHNPPDALTRIPRSIGGISGGHRRAAYRVVSAAAAACTAARHPSMRQVSQTALSLDRRLQKVVELPPMSRGCHVITRQILQQLPELQEFEVRPCGRWGPAVCLLLLAAATHCPVKLPPAAAACLPPLPPPHRWASPTSSCSTPPPR